MNRTNTRIRIAIQKSGRLSDASLNLLRCCGINIKLNKEQLICASDNFPLDLLLVRDDDIPQLVRDGMCDFGIVGQNILQEKMPQQNGIAITRYLNFGACRLSIAVPKKFTYESPKSLANCRIATSYPRLLQKFAEKNNIKIDIALLMGSVEIAPRLGFADGICDLVATGATLQTNNLREVEVIFKSQAVLISSMKSAKAKRVNREIFQNAVNKDISSLSQSKAEKTTIL